MPDRQNTPRTGSGPDAAGYNHSEEELALFRKETFAAIESVKKVVAGRRKSPTWIKPTLALCATGVAGVLVVFALQLPLVPGKSSTPPPVSRVRSQPSSLQPVYPVDNAAVPPNEVTLEWKTRKKGSYLKIVIFGESGDSLIEKELPSDTVQFAADLPSGRAYYWRVETSDSNKTSLQSFHVLSEDKWEHITAELLKFGLQGRDQEQEISHLDNINVLTQLKEFLAENKLHRLAESADQRINELRETR